MKISTSNIVKSFCAILLLGILAVSCRQDPIFYIISTETAPIPPRIPGSPTNMAVFEREYQYLSDPTDPDSAIKTGKTSLLFVASGRLHWYGGNPSAPGWDANYGIPQPGENIISLAVTKDRLYALCLNGNNLNATLRYIGHTGGWNTITGVGDYSLIQSIYADSETDRLFAGARINSKTQEVYAILYLDLKDNTLKLLKGNIAMLSGAACRDDIYYLSTRGKGIFRVSEANLKTNTINDTTVLPLQNIIKVETEVKIEPEIDPDNPPDPEDPPEIQIEIKNEVKEGNNSILFMSMIKLEDNSIIAIGRNNGILYEILTDADLDKMFDDVPDSSELLDNLKNGHAFSQMFYISKETGKPISSIQIGNFATSAIARWVDTDRGIKKLIVGRQGTLYSTSYNNGYVEFYLKDDGSFDKENPIRSMDTVLSYDRYSTSLGKRPINHLFQVPDKKIDSNMTLFASTQTGGLWSYRNRPNNGGWQWNAED